MWFREWWKNHGCPFDILPKEIQDAITQFSTAMKFTNYQLSFPVTLQFMAKYKCPWILKWHFEVNDQVMTRQFLVKWWDKFNSERILTQFDEEFPVTAGPSQCRTQIPTRSPQQAPIQQSQVIPQSTASQSSSSSKSKGKGKAVKKETSPGKNQSKADELKDLAKQLLKQAANLSQSSNRSSDEDPKSHSSRSSSRSSRSSSSSHSHQVTSSQPPRWANYQDSQDPFDL